MGYIKSGVKTRLSDGENDKNDIIFADYALSGFDGISALDISKVSCAGTPFIFISSTMGEELAIETLKREATDYVLNKRLSRLVPSLKRALSKAKEKNKRRKAVEELKKSNEQLRNLAAHLQSVREEERANIAREIHDELGQALDALKMNLSGMDEKLTTNEGMETLPELIKTDLELVKATIQAEKRLCTELRPALLNKCERIPPARPKAMRWVWRIPFCILGGIISHGRRQKIPDISD